MARIHPRWIKDFENFWGTKRIPDAVGGWASNSRSGGETLLIWPIHVDSSSFELENGMSGMLWGIFLKIPASVGVLPKFRSRDPSGVYLSRYGMQWKASLGQGNMIMMKAWSVVLKWCQLQSRHSWSWMLLLVHTEAFRVHIKLRGTCLTIVWVHVSLRKACSLRCACCRAFETNGRRELWCN